MPHPARNLMMRRPEISALSLVLFVTFLSFASIGFMSAIPVTIAAFAFALLQGSISPRLTKRFEIMYFTWIVLVISFGASLTLDILNVDVGDWLTWWAFLTTAALSIATISTLIWTVYTTQVERSEKIEKEKSAQASSISAMITSVPKNPEKQFGDKIVSLEVSNVSKQPIFDICISFGGETKQTDKEAEKFYKRVQVVPAKSDSLVKLEEKEQKTASASGLANGIVAFVFRDSLGEYWQRDWEGRLTTVPLNARGEKGVSEEYLYDFLKIPEGYEPQTFDAKFRQWFKQNMST